VARLFGRSGVRQPDQHVAVTRPRFRSRGIDRESPGSLVVFVSRPRVAPTATQSSSRRAFGRSIRTMRLAKEPRQTGKIAVGPTGRDRAARGLRPSRALAFVAVLS
jgi:hypothetical protein